MKPSRLPLTLAIALGMGATPAFGLGLGAMEVKSGLNQPLVAEIPILGASPSELENLSVRLASPDAFARVGLPRPAGITANLQFAVTRNGRGQPVLMVSTSSRVDDPYLSFLLEADFGRGSVVREYTALLDPPTIAPAFVQPVQQAVVSAPAPVAQAAPVAAAPDVTAPAVAEVRVPEAPAASQPMQEPAAVSEPVPMAVVEAPAAPAATFESVSPAPEPVAAQPVAPPPPAPSPEPPPAAIPEATPAPQPVAQTPPPPPTPAVPGPQEAPRLSSGDREVSRGETLWSIANQTRADQSVSIQQMLLAIQRANPDAFIGGDINKLRAGAILRIPGREEALTLNDQAARDEVREKLGMLRESTPSRPQPVAAEVPAARPPSRPTPAPTATPAAAAKPAPETATAAAPTRPATSATRPAAQPRLEIAPAATGSAPNAQSGAVVGGGGNELRAELRQAREDLSASEAEIAELKSRLAEQESLTSEQRKLIELKDSQLSAMEQALRDQREAPPAAAVKPETTAPDAAPEAAPAAESTPEGDATSGPLAMLKSPAVLGVAVVLGLGGLIAFLLRRRRSVVTPAAAAKTAASTATRSRLSDDAEFLSSLPASTPDATAPQTEVADVDSASADEDKDTALAEPVADAPFDASVEVQPSWAAAADDRSDEREAVITEEVPTPDAESVPPPYEAPDDSVEPIEEMAPMDTGAVLRRQLQDEVFDAPMDLDRHIALLRQLYQDGDGDAFRAAAVAMKANVDDSNDPRWREVVVLGLGLLPGDALFRDVQWNAVSAADVSVREEMPRATPSLAAEPDAPVLPESEATSDDTRLELARAYVEIGDSDGARAMLEEVLADGDVAAKRIAERLLRDLG